MASAATGSGKMAVLVERIIRMISEGDRPLDIDQLLVMTFTNTVAVGIRERIGAAVEQKLKEHPEDGHPWFQVAPIPRAQIIIIDSPCSNIIRSHYNSLDIDPAFCMEGEGKLSFLRGDYMGEMPEGCYDEANAEFARFTEHSGRGKSDRGTEDAILQAWQSSQSHPWSEEWLALCQRELEEESILKMEGNPWVILLMKDVARQAEEPSGQLGEAVQMCLEEDGSLVYEPMLTSDRSKIETTGRAAATGSFEVPYNGLQNVSFSRLASIQSRGINGDKKAFISACRDRVKEAVAEYRELCDQQGPGGVVESVRGTRMVIRGLLRLTDMFDQAYRDAERERNVLGSNGLKHLTLEVLYKREETGDGEETVFRRPFQVVNKLSQQYEEILVDEYQDNNYVQEVLITGISRERSNHSSMSMMGGIKQSIYRLRLARPELFMDKYGTYSRERGSRQMIELQQNFRSRESMLTGINDMFYQVIARNLGGITYTPETALYPGAEFEEVSGKMVLDPEVDVGKSGNRKTTPVSLKAGMPMELLLVDTGADILKQLDEDSPDYTAKELEARLITGRIRQLVSEDQGILVWDKPRGGYRRARYGDMVILLRSMSGWSEVLVNVLMNEDIPAFTQIRAGYFNMVEVETILSLLSVVDNPMQDISLATVMHSSTVGMDDEEVAWVMVIYKQNSRKGQNRGVHGA